MADSYQQYLQQLGQYTTDQKARNSGSVSMTGYNYANNFPSFQAWQGGQGLSDAYNGKSYGFNRGAGAGGGPSYDQGKANAAAGTSGYSDPTNGLTGQARVDASRGQVFANTEGRGQATLNDPYTQAALDRFKGVASGQYQPYDATTKNALLTSASNASAAAEGAQAQQLQQQIAMNGGSVNDPATQAALRELASNRQGANQNALNNINMTANQANFDAANQGASQLAGVRSNQTAQANQMYLAGAGYRAQDYATSESPGGMMRLGNGMVGNQGYNPSPLPNISSSTPSGMGQAPTDLQPQTPSYYAGTGASQYNPTPPTAQVNPAAGNSVTSVAQVQPGQGPMDYMNQLAGNNPMGLQFGLPQQDYLLTGAYGDPDYLY